MLGQISLLQQMHFLSSKVVHQLETAFNDILNNQRVKEGQMKLEKLKKQPSYELALATFISRSQNYNQRLLAVLQLQKKLFINNSQTFWSLKEVYYRDSDKIATKICKIITAKDNIKLASDFLVLNENLTGLSVFREIQIVFNFLKDEQKAFLAIQHHYSLLYNYFIKIISRLNTYDQCFSMVVVCLSLFYSSYIKMKKLQIDKQIQSHWQQIKHKCQQGRNDQSLLIFEAIKHIIQRQNTSFRYHMFQNFLKNIFTSISRNNTIKLQYQSKALEFLIQNNNILSSHQLRKEFVQCIKFYNSSKIMNMLYNFSIYGEIEIQFSYDLQLQSKDQLLVRQICNRLIQQLFSQYYTWIKFQHLPIYASSIESFEYLLSLTNYSGAAHAIPNQELTQFINQVYILLESQNMNPNHKINQTQTVQIITLIEFLTKYKFSIQISLLPKIVNTIIQKRKNLNKFIPFCDAFLSVIWKEMTYIPINELIDFIQHQLQQINNNQLTVTFELYECFLHLALYLEQSFKYFSTCNESDTLLNRLLDSHAIICQIVRQNTSKKFNFELFELLLELTSVIIQNKLFSSNYNMINRLNIPFIAEIIEKRLLLSDVSATIISFHHYHNHSLLVQLKKQSHVWGIDELDYTYRIQLYLKYIEYSIQMLPSTQIDSLTQSLGNKIIEFLKTITLTQLDKFKETKLFYRLEQKYNVIAHISYRREFQFT